MWLNCLARLFKRSLASQTRSKTFSVCPRLLSKYHAISWKRTDQTKRVFIIRSKFFCLFVGREPTTWPANNCLQIMVCSCAMLSNWFWLQIIFCTCLKETVLSPSFATCNNLICYKTGWWVVIRATSLLNSIRSHGTKQVARFSSVIPRRIFSTHQGKFLSIERLQCIQFSAAILHVSM